MDIKIHSFIGVKSASFTLDKITLIAGDNEAGKSSINRAVASALTGQAIPVAGILKNMAGMLVHRGVAKGGVTITTPTGTANVEWPRASLKTTGEPPKASEYACGLTHLAELTPKERASILVDLLQASPTIDDLSAALKPQGVPIEAVQNIWDMIVKNNWDSAHAHAKDTGARLKGQWEATTGLRYGSKVAQSFTPQEWEPDLDGASEELLASKVTDCRDALEGMIAIVAVDESKRELMAQADQLSDRVDNLNKALQEESRSLQEYQAHQSSLINLSDTQASTPCPHCQGALRVVGGRVEVPREVTQADKDAWDEAVNKVHLQKQVVAEIRQNLAQANEQLRLAKEVPAEGNATQQEVEHARNELKDAERRLHVWQVKTKADRINNSIQNNIAIVQALDMTGVRQAKLADCLNGFMTVLASITTQAGWETISIDSDMAIMYGDTPYVLLSKSAQWRVNVAIQVAISKYDNSCAVLIDGADILGKAGRNGLFKMLRGLTVPTLLNMTMADMDSMPKLPENIGSSHWIEKGVLG